MSDKAKIENTSDLRAMLLETISQVRAGTLEPQQARTIATLSTTILQSAKLDLDYLRFTAAQDKAIEAKDRVLNLIAS